MKDHEIEVCFLGARGVGKSSLIMSIAKSTFDVNVQPTIGTNFEKRDIIYHNQTYSIHMYDTTGDERFLGSLPLFIRKKHLIALCYDISSPSSLDFCVNNLKELIDKREKEAVVVLIATKCDLEKSPLITEDQYNNALITLNPIKTFEVSSKFHEGVDEFFESIPILVPSPCDFNKNNLLRETSFPNIINKQNICNC